MPVFKTVDGVVVQVWRDVASIEEFLDKYGDEEGLQEGEALPGQLWDGMSLSNPVPEPAQTPANLSPARFAYMLALTGFDDVWDAMEAATKDADRRTYATLKANRNRTLYRLEETLAMVAAMSDLASQVAPDVDLSEEAIRAAWHEAADWSGASAGEPPEE